MFSGPFQPLLDQSVVLINHLLAIVLCYTQHRSDPSKHKTWSSCRSYLILVLKVRLLQLKARIFFPMLSIRPLIFPFSSYFSIKMASTIHVITFANSLNFSLFIKKFSKLGNYHAIHKANDIHFHKNATFPH